MDNKNPAVDEANGKINATADERNDFFNTGRIGRRNALPDILGNHCTTSTAELPLLLDSLSTKGNHGFSYLYASLIFGFFKIMFRSTVNIRTGPKFKYSKELNGK